MRCKWERRRPPDEIKVIANKKLDEMERHTMTKEERKTWERKPYCYGKANG